jgi:ABC-type ATPase with predicted acetyltransferase domain
LNSVPSWYKPYQVLSNGEKFRADLARKLKSNTVIDEFTSVVDRTVAKAASVSLFDI